MFDITEQIKKIRNAIYGRDVREAIATALTNVNGNHQEVVDAANELAGLIENANIEEISNTVSALSNQIDGNGWVTPEKTTFVGTSKNLFNYDDIIIYDGYMDANAAVKSDTASKCFYFPVTPGNTYTFSTIGKLSGSAYLSQTDAAHKRIGTYTTLSGLQSPYTFAVAATETIKYLAITIPYTTDLSAYMAVEGSSLPSSYIAPGVTVGGVVMSDLQRKLKKGSITPDLTSFMSESTNLFDYNKITIRKGAIKADGSVNADINAKCFYLPVTPGKTYTFSKVGIQALETSSTLIVDVDDSYNRVGLYDTVHGIQEAYTHTVPVNNTIKYIGVSIPYGTDIYNYMIVEGSSLPSKYVAPGLTVDGVSLGNLSAKVEQIGGTKYLNKKYLCFGDSFTAMGKGGSSNWTSHFIAAMSPASLTIKAVSGASYVGTNGVVSQVTSAIADTSLEAPDIITILCGANETAARYEPGEIEKYFTDDSDNIIPLSNIDTSTTTKTTGAIRWCVEKLRAAYPNAKIFICTPTQEGIQSNGTWFRTFADTKGKRDAQIEIAERLSVEIIDTFNCGICNTTWSTWLQTDGIHPNEKGAKLIAEMIAGAVKDYYNRRMED